jgi:hypothetical protein
MIKITYNITGLPVPGGQELLSLALSDEMKLTFMALRAYAADNGCNIITIPTDDGQRTDIFEWVSRELLDSFYTYANTLVNYDQFIEEYRAVLASVGATQTRTEEEI